MMVNGSWHRSLAVLAPYFVLLLLIGGAAATWSQDFVAVRVVVPWEVHTHEVVLAPAIQVQSNFSG